MSSTYIGFKKKDQDGNVQTYKTFFQVYSYPTLLNVIPQLFEQRGFESFLNAFQQIVYVSMKENRSCDELENMKLDIKYGDGEALLLLVEMGEALNVKESLIQSARNLTFAEKGISLREKQKRFERAINDPLQNNIEPVNGVLKMFLLNEDEEGNSEKPWEYMFLIDLDERKLEIYDNHIGGKTLEGKLFKVVDG